MFPATRITIPGEQQQRKGEGWEIERERERETGESRHEVGKTNTRTGHGRGLWRNNKKRNTAQKEEIAVRGKDGQERWNDVKEST